VGPAGWARMSRARSTVGPSAGCSAPRGGGAWDRVATQSWAWVCILIRGGVCVWIARSLLLRVRGRATGSSGERMLPQAGIIRTRVRRIGRHPLGTTWVRVGYPLLELVSVSTCQRKHGLVPKRLRMPLRLYCTCAVLPLYIFSGSVRSRLDSRAGTWLPPGTHSWIIWGG